MITAELSCAMCGKEKIVPLHVGHVTEKTLLEEIIKDAGWIAQQNGAILDIYCSKKCSS